MSILSSQLVSTDPKWPRKRLHLCVVRAEEQLFITSWLHRNIVCADTESEKAADQRWNRKSVCKPRRMFTTGSLRNNFAIFFLLFVRLKSHSVMCFWHQTKLFLVMWCSHGASDVTSASHCRLIMRTCSQTVVYLDIKPLQSSISLQYELCFWPPRACKSKIHSRFSSQFGPMLL